MVQSSYEEEPIIPTTSEYATAKEILFISMIILWKILNVGLSRVKSTLPK
jgi:hypothetical protein